VEWTVHGFNNVGFTFLLEDVHVFNVIFIAAICSSSFLLLESLRDFSVISVLDILFYVMLFYTLVEHRFSLEK